MKIASYHKLRGDNVVFAKGCKPDLQKMAWDRIYISTLFSFYWKKTVDTISYYKKHLGKQTEIYIGGIMATLFADELERDYGVKVIRGLLDKKGQLDTGDHKIIDTLIPDYSILESISYNYGLQDTYIGYATRGCPNRCSFCAVNSIEPVFCHYLPIKRQVQGIESLYGSKKDLVLCDNNVLASNQFDKIIEDIIDLGFYKGATHNGRLRYVDFNQGIDARLLNAHKMKLLSTIAIKPIRIAFDHISMKDLYVDKIKLAKKYDLLNLSNYILYNYNDKPEHFYDRLKINVELNESLGTHIFSFPMKYIPLLEKDRTYVGKYWNRQILRGIQCVLLATGGKVGTRREFFHAAFGESFSDFLEIVLMPEEYIIYRKAHSTNGALDWKKNYKALSINQKAELMLNLSLGKITDDNIKSSNSVRLKRIYSHYIEAAKLHS